MIAEPRGHRETLLLKSVFSRSLWLRSGKTVSEMVKTIRLVGHYRAYSTYPMHDLTEAVHEGIDSEGLAAQKSPTQSARERALHLFSDTNTAAHERAFVRGASSPKYRMACRP